MTDLETLETAAEFVHRTMPPTPQYCWPLLSRRLGAEIWVKHENHTPIGAFKLRGAYNKMVNLPAASLRRGVICASAGNHAQGVAYAAQRLGCEATIVMPATTPQIKVAAVAARGARVVLTGDSYDDAYTHAVMLGKRRKLAFVHPYDDPLVIAGQGTTGCEIVDDLAAEGLAPDVVVVCASGGGPLATALLLARD